MVRSGLILLAIAACGGGSSDTVDAPNLPRVEKVACPISPAMITGEMGAFVPVSTTLPIGGIVRFQVTYQHDVVPDTSMDTDALIDVGPFEGTCLKFNQAGTFGFRCTVDDHAGTIVVN